MAAPRAHAESGDDARLARVAAALPKGWSMTVETDKVTFLRAGDIWVLNENRINGPVSTKTAAQQDAWVRSHGVRTQGRLTFRLEPKWSTAKWTETKQKNAAVWSAIEALPAKYRITDLYDARLSRKGTPTYIARNADDEQRIQACHKESDELQKTLLPLPVHESEQFSLFEPSPVGAVDDMHQVSPQQASAELYQVQVLIQKECPLRPR